MLLKNIFEKFIFTNTYSYKLVDYFIDMGYCILKRNGETIYQGHDGEVMENLIPRQGNDMPSVVYDYYTIARSEGTVYMTYGRKATRNDVDDGVKAKVRGHVEIPLPELEKLLMHLHSN